MKNRALMNFVKRFNLGHLKISEAISEYRAYQQAKRDIQEINALVLI
jgi:hypothetical protein